MADIFNTINSSTIIPDLFKVAGSSWGIETICICILPMFIASFLLLILILQVFQISKQGRGKNIKQIKIGLLSTLYVFLILQFMQWKELFNFMTQPTDSIVFTYFLLGGVFIFSIIWVLLIILFWNSFHKVRFYMPPSLLYGISSLYFIWYATGSGEIQGQTLILSGSLLSISLALIAGLLSQVNSKQDL